MPRQKKMKSRYVSEKTGFWWRWKAAHFSLEGLNLFSKVRDRTVGKEKGIGDKHQKARKFGMPAVRSMCGLSKCWLTGFINIDPMWWYLLARKFPDQSMTHFCIDNMNLWSHSCIPFPCEPNSRHLFSFHPSSILHSSLLGLPGHFIMSTL